MLNITINNLYFIKGFFVKNCVKENEDHDEKSSMPVRVKVFLERRDVGEKIKSISLPYKYFV